MNDDDEYDGLPSLEDDIPAGSVLDSMTLRRRKLAAAAERRMHAYQ